ncbi:hypothetical protein BC826DRAFT_473985 [Russula brevipes]|nr:hypothetical protein BC826DRAFT_473985 [Russula brevipes]
MTQPGTPPAAPSGIGYTRPPSVSTIPLAPEGRQTRGPLGPRSALPCAVHRLVGELAITAPLGVDYSPPPSKPTIHLAPEVPQIRGHPTRSSSKSSHQRPHVIMLRPRARVPHSVESAPLLPVTESTNLSTPSPNHPPFPPAVSHGTAKTIGSWMTGTVSTPIFTCHR